jgi:hypothetical protein
MLRLLSILIFTAACFAQISAPRIGIARYPDGSLHALRGLSANIIVSDLPVEPVDAASFSDRGGIVSHKGVLRLLNSELSTVAEYNAGPGKPLLSINDELTSALAWISSNNTLIHWDGSQFRSVTVTDPDLSGRVTDLQFSRNLEAQLTVVHADKTVSLLNVSLQDGSVLTWQLLPGVRGETFTQGSDFVYTTATELLVDNLRGSRRSLPLPAADLQIERMSNNWFNLYSPSQKQNWALHVTHADVSISQLPGLSAPMSSAIRSK